MLTKALIFLSSFYWFPTEHECVNGDLAILEWPFNIVDMTASDGLQCQLYFQTLGDIVCAQGEVLRQPRIIGVVE